MTTEVEVEEEMSNNLPAVRGLPWKKTTAPEFQDCPHEYIVRRVDSGTAGVPVEVFDALAKVIRAYGQMRAWRGKRFRYLSAGPYVYWRCGHVINRSFESSLENDGWPGPESRARIQARFGRVNAPGRHAQKAHKPGSRQVKR